MRFLFLLPLAGVASMFARPLVAGPDVNINVNVTVTDEGQKVPRPEGGSEVYYYPVLAGYTEGELPIGGIMPPSNKEVVRLLAKALASQGYRVFSSEKAPTLQLVFTWGYMNAHSGSSSSGKFLLTLVNGQPPPTTNDEPVGTWIRTSEHKRVLAEASDDRYYVTIAAYDYETAPDPKTRVLLWEARMSVPMEEVASFTEVLPTLLQTAAPRLGRETLPPYRVTLPLIASPDPVLEKIPAAEPKS